MPKGRHNVLRCQARKIVYDVLMYMKKEADDGLQYDLRCVQKRTAAATGVSEKTVKKIATPVNDSGSDLLEVFRKKKSEKKTVSGLDNFTKGAIKRIIHNFHVTEGVLPTIGQLLRKLKTEIKYEWSASSLRRILKELGFKWKKTVDDKKILIESSNIRLKRIEYLMKIARYRAEGRPIVYTDELYIDSSSTKDSTNGVVIVHAGCEAGFVPNALLMFKAGTKTGHYRSNMNYENYEEWVRTHLVPNLPPNSVVVMDNAPYHNKLEDAPPTSYSTKAEMISWLYERNIPCSTDMFKPELFKLISIHKEKTKKYNIDRILKENHHNILRLPPYHPDLNPMEMVWEEIKEFVAKNKGMDSISNVMKLVEDKANTMGENEWKGFCDRIMRIEDEYKKSDVIIDDLTDQVTIDESENESEEEANSDTSEDDSSTDEEPSSSSRNDFSAIVTNVFYV